MVFHLENRFNELSLIIYLGLWPRKAMVGFIIMISLLPHLAMLVIVSLFCLPIPIIHSLKMLRLYVGLRRIF